MCRNLKPTGPRAWVKRRDEAPPAFAGTAWRPARHINKVQRIWVPASPSNGLANDWRHACSSLTPKGPPDRTRPRLRPPNRTRLHVFAISAAPPLPKTRPIDLPPTTCLGRPAADDLPPRRSGPCVFVTERAGVSDGCLQGPNLDLEDSRAAPPQIGHRGLNAPCRPSAPYPAHRHLHAAAFYTQSRLAARRSVHAVMESWLVVSD